MGDCLQNPLAGGEERKPNEREGKQEEEAVEATLVFFWDAGGGKRDCCKRQCDKGSEIVLHSDHFAQVFKRKKGTLRRSVDYS